MGMIMGARCKFILITLVLFSLRLRGATPLSYNSPVSIISHDTKSCLWVHPSHWKSPRLFHEVFSGDPLYHRDQNNSQLFIIKNTQDREKIGPVYYGDELELYSIGHGGFRKDGFANFNQPCRLLVNPIENYGKNGEIVVDLQQGTTVSLSSTFTFTSPQKKKKIIEQGDAVFIKSKLFNQNLWQGDTSRFGDNFKECLVGDVLGSQNPGLGDRSKQRKGLFSLVHVQKKKEVTSKKVKKQTKKNSANYRWIQSIQMIKKRWNERNKLLSQSRKESRLKKTNNTSLQK